MFRQEASNLTSRLGTFILLSLHCSQSFTKKIMSRPQWTILQNYRFQRPTTDQVCRCREPRLSSFFLMIHPAVNANWILMVIRRRVCPVAFHLCCQPGVFHSEQIDGIPQNQCSLLKSDSQMISELRQQKFLTTTWITSGQNGVGTQNRF